MDGTILADLLEKIYSGLNPEEIKRDVDDLGIDKFIRRCATYAALSGGANGFFGFTTMIVGLPADVINNVIQQFRVTLAIIYYKKGIYKMSFPDFMKIVGASLGVEMGATLTKGVLFIIAGQIVARMAASTAVKAIPFIGAGIGGGVNYAFISSIGAAVKALPMT